MQPLARWWSAPREPQLRCPFAFGWCITSSRPGWHIRLAWRPFSWLSLWRTSGDHRWVRGHYSLPSPPCSAVAACMGAPMNLPLPAGWHWPSSIFMPGQLGLCVASLRSAMLSAPRWCTRIVYFMWGPLALFDVLLRWVQGYRTRSHQTDQYSH